jgi:hypothetical protein
VCDGVVQAVYCLPSKHKALSLNLSIAKDKKKERKKNGELDSEAPEALHARERLLCWI